jgi:hypothetical protein
VRRALDTYERAIEGKDVALFRSVRPTLSADEERRLRASFAQIDKQEIDMRVEQVTIAGDTAEARGPCGHSADGRPHADVAVHADHPSCPPRR